jgi:uncharacterized membrane protein
MSLARSIRHLCASQWLTRRRFNAEVLQAIEQAIRAVESRHAGEIRFAIETALDLPELWRDVTPRQRAIQVFGQLGVWDTEANNGVLLYLLNADRAVEIVADRGVAARVTKLEWAAVERLMEEHFRAGRYREGAVQGIEAVGKLLQLHFPSQGADRDEQPNQAILL